MSAKVARASRKGSKYYFLEQDLESILFSREVEQSAWLGSGAKSLGIEGLKVTEQQFDFICQGYGPDGLPLSGRLRSLTTLRGWDVVLSVPKSLSIFHQASLPGIQTKIEKAVDVGLREVVRRIEKNHAFIRQPQGDSNEKAKLVIAKVLHGSSRAGDPHLHPHLVIGQLGQSVTKGDWAPIEARKLFQMQREISAVFNLALTRELVRTLNVAIHRDAYHFRLGGVPETLVRAMSKRREEILTTMHGWGATGPWGATIAALATRPESKPSDVKELQRKWQTEFAAHDFTAAKIEKRSAHQELVAKIIPVERQIEAAINVAAKKLAKSQSHFTERELTLAASSRLLGRDVDYGSVEKATQRILGLEQKQIIKIGNQEKDKEAVYSTKEQLRREAAVIAKARNLETERHKPVNWGIHEALLDHKTLSEAQKKLVVEAAKSKSQLQVIAGLSGSGVRETVATVADAYKADGRKVYAVSLSGPGKERLLSMGIESFTLPQFQKLTGWRSNPWLMSYLETHKNGFKFNSVAQALAFQSAVHKSILEARIRLKKGDLVIVDGAENLTTKEAKSLFGKIEKSGCKLVLAGEIEEQQLRKDTGIFQKLAREKKNSDMLTAHEAVRSSQEIRAVEALRKNDPVTALKNYFEQGNLHIAEHPIEAKQAMVERFIKESREKLEKHVIIAQDKQEAKELSEAVQIERKNLGQLGRVSMTIGDLRINNGDRVILTQNEYRSGAREGMIGTAYIHPIIDRVSLYVDGHVIKIDREALLPPAKGAEPKIKLAYALESHEVQGNYDRAYLLLGSGNGAEHGPVQLTKAASTLLFADKLTGGDKLEMLLHSLSTKEPRKMGIEIAEENQMKLNLETIREKEKQKRSMEHERA